MRSSLCKLSSTDYSCSQDWKIFGWRWFGFHDMMWYTSIHQQVVEVVDLPKGRFDIMQMMWYTSSVTSTGYSERVSRAVWGGGVSVRIRVSRPSFHWVHQWKQKFRDVDFGKSPRHLETSGHKDVVLTLLIEKSASNQGQGSGSIPASSTRFLGRLKNQHFKLGQSGLMQTSLRRWDQKFPWVRIPPTWLWFSWENHYWSMASIVYLVWSQWDSLSLSWVRSLLLQLGTNSLREESVPSLTGFK